MGLGKTVEVLACVLSNPPVPYPPAPAPVLETLAPGVSVRSKHAGRGAVALEESVCLCGIAYESGCQVPWIQCCGCAAWMHTMCTGHAGVSDDVECTGVCLSQYKPVVRVQRTPQGRAFVPDRVYCARHVDDLRGPRVPTPAARDAGDADVDMGRDAPLPFCCVLCAKRLRTDLIATGATLIVCPTKILAQWEEELKRHTTQGTLRILVSARTPGPPAPPQPRHSCYRPAAHGRTPLPMLTYVRWCVFESPGVPWRWRLQATQEESRGRTEARPRARRTP